MLENNGKKLVKMIIAGGRNFGTTNIKDALVRFHCGIICVKEGNSLSHNRMSGEMWHNEKRRLTGINLAKNGQWIARYCADKTCPFVKRCDTKADAVAARESFEVKYKRKRAIEKEKKKTAKRRLI